MEIFKLVWRVIRVIIGVFFLLIGFKNIADISNSESSHDIMVNLIVMIICFFFSYIFLKRNNTNESSDGLEIKTDFEEEN